MGERMRKALEKYHQIHEKNRLGGGVEHIERQHKRGKLTARERIDLLIDPGTFNELGAFVGTTSTRIDGRVPEAPCDGAVCGTAMIHGRPVMIHASDFTVLGGSAGVQHLMKFAKPLEMAARWGIPMINLLDSSGGRLGYEDVAMADVEWHFKLESMYSGVIPQITILLGPCIAGGAYLPTLSDFLFMSRISATMWLGGPRQTQAATSEKFDADIGKADYHMRLSGTCDVVGEDDPETIQKCRELMSYLPDNHRQKPPALERGPESGPDHAQKIMDIFPDDFDAPYDMKEIIKLIVDDGKFFEIKDDYAPSLVACFCRLGGRAVGIVANNPAFDGGMLEINVCDKYYRFLQVLDAYRIPLVCLVDTPPIVPGEEEEAKGLLRHTGKITDVYATASIPKITVVLRQAYADAGGLIMGVPKSMGSDLVFAWPTARFAVEGSTFDCATFYGKGVEENALEAYMRRSREKVDVYDAARSWSAQVVDEIIPPGDTRKKIIDALRLTESKKETPPDRLKGHSAAPV
ncbi:Acetyl-CoA carboxylase, carboxyltransferase component [Candidatus Desulfarcum epimagneticum]|uniref:Acetyl-CoA carboxylase, carboxyltransferase component n=1 Tax=uncultured Desulfobacteraceae bacterium TaxID=218296 RepID=A0A484HJD8_9BACT|nr:Acetyl-CoA carboxylase, carboxyltransferase component [uncultured Desulfobacteraceae bacterium]